MTRLLNVIALDPVPASRPRVTNYGTFYPKRYAEWKDAALDYIDAFEEPLEGPVSVTIDVLCKRPKRLTSDIPVGDADNFAKAVLDAITSATGVWHDDKQVTRLVVRKRYAAPGEMARTEVLVEPDSSYSELDSGEEHF